MMLSRFLALGLASASLFGLGCAPAEEGDDLNPIADVFPGSGDKADTSAIATVLNFTWDGSVELDTASFYDTTPVLESLLYYTVGSLNGSNAVGRMDRVVWSNVKTTEANGRTTISYRAKMPVSWGSKTNLPKKFIFRLPKRADDFAGFTAKYKDSCAEDSPHEVDESSMWYYYRPQQTGCSLDAADLVKSTAKVTVSTENTAGKYPEYNKVWEDSALRVVAIFGKYEKGNTTSADDGIAAYNEFNRAVRAQLGSLGTFTVLPASTPEEPGVAAPDVAFSGKLPDGRMVYINALLVDEVSSATETFYQRYEALSPNADMIVYNGHAGLGANIRTLASRGQFNPGQYSIIFMNGCDTYTYIDGALAEKHMAINPDDTTGTKYMDMVVNSMPAFFASDASASMAVINGLLSYAHPKTYQQILANIDPHQVVLVTGEKDNKYKP